MKQRNAELARALAIGRDAVADVYHDAWPPYSEALFDIIVASTGVRPTARVLEIGCGTGRATLPLAERGFSIVALEPGPRLAAEARKRLAGFSSVTIEEAFFEKWPVVSEGFDLVMSAQAFHWVDPTIGVPNVAKTLRPEGSLAFFWRKASHRSSELSDAIQRVLDGFNLVLPLRGYFFDVATEVKSDIEKSRAFDEVAVTEFSASITYDTQGYLRHLGVYPAYAALPEDTRRTLLDRVARVLDEAGGVAEIAIVTMLYVARKKRC